MQPTQYSSHVDTPQLIVAQQPTTKNTMNATMKPPGESPQTEDVLRLRGGCPGKLCGLPILPCKCDICIIPIPCCC
ncbi:hypothetical protein CspeluHIS016_0405390 [Cutaneotrichosporon spelunceum]|uniref:Uncharacterized protein n=1 Tax=Cutaneotrichosporon spelunceum TaxID=1672016 RepID=A0AAD3TVL8_9TREE|nr:hypothetical protein CspeluHIS016_0405390 [Cutaneotrichosporon spelunceum]